MLIGPGFAALLLIRLTGPDNQLIELNPKMIISLRAPRGTDHFAAGTKCLVFTSDGKFIPVLETCAQVHELIGDGK